MSLARTLDPQDRPGRVPGGTRTVRAGPPRTGALTAAPNAASARLTGTLRYGLGARVLFLLLDSIYGKRRTLSKFKVLELVARVPYQAWEHQGVREGRIRFLVIPQLLAFVYYELSWVLYVVNPAWSYRLNADFEDHAEHEYANLVAEHDEWETTPFESSFAPDYGDYESMADLFRQIGYDERMHKEESVLRVLASAGTGRP